MRLARISRILDKTVKKVGPLLKIFAPCLIIGIYLKYSMLVYSQEKYTTIFLSAYLLILVLFNFFKAATLKSNSIVSGNGEICKICSSEKSNRSHHCSICNKCVRKMDHHCPWIDNWYFLDLTSSVGQENHRYFLLFLVYTSLLCMIIVWDLSAKFYLVFSCKMALRKEAWCTSLRDRSFMFSYLVAALAGSALWSLSFWHTFLIASGQTTIEFYKNQVSKELLDGDFRNPYDNGWKENLKEFFNISKEYPWFFVLLPVTIPSSFTCEDF